MAVSCFNVDLLWTNSIPIVSSYIHQSPIHSRDWVISV